MTELEFEKACRGSGQPAVPGEYAWGTNKIVSLTGFDGIDGSGTEKANPPEANTSFQRIIKGPIRIGIFEGKSTRELSGASYYGVMDLSGNVVEMAVTIGNAAGRRFLGNHGDGEINEQGFANVPSWPRISQSGPPNVQGDLVQGGFGYRGGDFWNPELDLRVSARNVATFPGPRRLFGLGFRAVRTAN
jgi:formylglycine-generating enzyme required for sulfatase activity